MRAHFDQDDPKCWTSDGEPIIWINVDNWVQVTGTDCEEITLKIRDSFNKMFDEPEDAHRLRYVTRAFNSTSPSSMGRLHRVPKDDVKGIRIGDVVEIDREMFIVKGIHEEDEASTIIFTMNKQPLRLVNI